MISTTRKNNYLWILESSSEYWNSKSRIKSLEYNLNQPLIIKNEYIYTVRVTMSILQEYFAAKRILRFLIKASNQKMPESTYCSDTMLNN